MTRGEIMAMEPGRILDRMVQKHIFKWIPWMEKRVDYLVVTYQKPGEKEPYMRSQNWRTEKDRYSIIEFSEIDPMKHAVYGDKDFSTEIALAWEVEAIFEQDTKLRGDYAIELNNVLGLKLYELTTLDNIYKLAHATPEQRCKAALLVFMNL
ncbi:hypothetical protein [Paenibacillus sp. FSL P4-0288]|uniref:hypothetical protein n=1 Tax=Paenibacillus sp. FSL P4-0288 TaxID=2921633 RepID=UPI0030F97797